MRKKVFIALLIIFVVVMMVLDIKYNGLSSFKTIFRELNTTGTVNELQLNFSYPGDIKNHPSADIEVEDRKITLSKDIKRLCMNNEMGSINITGEKRKDISLSFILTVYAEEEEKAVQFIEELDIVDYIREEDLMIELKRPELIKGIEGIKVDYKLVVPEELLLDIKNRFGNFVVINMSGDITLKSSFCEMDIRNISGKTDISAAYGELYVENIKNSLKIDSAFTKVICNNLSSDFYTKTAYGQLSIQDLDNNLQVNGSYSTINIELNDKLMEYGIKIKTEYGKINTNLPLKIEKKDNIQLMEGSEGQGNTVKINVNNKYGDINIYKKE